MQLFTGWQNNGQYRGQYPPPSGPQQWSGGQRPPQPGGQPPNWDRYGPQGQPGPYPGGQPNQSHWGPMGHSGAGGPGQNMPGSPNIMRSGQPSQPQHQQQRNKPMPMMPVQQPGGKPMPPGQFMPQGSVSTKRDIVFPIDSVEATVPVYYRRKRIAKSDIGPVDPWRIFMALRSGLLVESTWALDVINILLFDDSSIQYFGLAHLPGLLNLLLDHFQKSLADMFNSKEREDLNGGQLVASRHSANAIRAEEEREEEAEEAGNEEPVEPQIKLEPVDLGCVKDVPDPSQRSLMFRSTTNYTMTTRKGIPVKFNHNSCEEDLFVTNEKRDWDLESDHDALLRCTTGGDPWTYGHTDLNPHDFLMGCFKAEMVKIPFARFIKKEKKTVKVEENAENSAAKDPVAGEGEEKEMCSDVTEPEVVTRKSGKGRMGKKVRADSPVKLEVQVKQEPEDVTSRLNGPTTEASATAAEERKKEMATNGDDETEQEMEIDDDEADKNLFNLTDHIRDPARVLKRRRMSDYEDECYTRDEASLYLVNESQDCLARRCVGISNILRNLSFVPGNELEFANSSTFLSVLGQLLLIHHTHPVRAQKTRNYDREEDVDFSDSCSSLAKETEWWWDYLVQIRENMLVAAANISGYMELSRYEEIISRPVLDGLLHWAVCPSAHGQDPFPTCGPHTQLSPQRLALEALCKLCVTDANVDLVIATPPFSRLEKLCAVLTRHLCRNEEQVLREFSVNLLHYLVAADSAMARTVAMQSPCISYLVAFIEQAEQTALGVANQHGINYLRDNPDSMGTSLDMLRRAAGTLLHLSRHPDNRPLFVQQEQRLLALVMSHILDQQVALIISRVLFQVSRGTGPMLSVGVKTIDSLMSNSGSSSDKRISKQIPSIATVLGGKAGTSASTSETEKAPAADEGTKSADPKEVVEADKALVAAASESGEADTRKTVNNIDKVLKSTKMVVDGENSTTNSVGEEDSKAAAGGGEVYNAAPATTGSCGKQQMPATNSSGPTSPPQASTGGSQLLTSPIVSISS